MAAVVRPCLKAVFSGNSRKFGTRSFVFGLLAICLWAGVAAANCGISTYTYTPSATFGPTDTATPGIHRCLEADPINCATGNLTETYVDLKVNGHGPSLQAARTYNSQLAAAQTSPGSFGYGWTGPYSAHLTFANGKSLVTVHHDNGSSINFEQSGSAYNAPAWTQATFAQSGENYIYTQPDLTKLEFNGTGRLLKITDRHNLSLVLTYNASGKLETVANVPVGLDGTRKLTFAYNGSGQVEKITDPMGRVAKYGYTSGNLTSVTLPGVETPRWKFGYNAFHEMTSITNGRGHTMTTTYDSAHRATTQTDPLGRKHTFEYKETNGIDETTVTEPNGAVTVKKFNEAGEPLSITRAYGTTLAATSTYTYNSAFLVTSATDPNGHTTTFTYDSRGNKLTEKDPNGNETKWTYNTTNDIVSITIPKGTTTTITRNAMGDPTLIKKPIGASFQETKFAYNEWGDLTQVTDPAGRVRIFNYVFSYGQPFNEYASSVTAANFLRGWRYNGNGEVVEEIGGRGFETSETAKYTTKVTRDSQGRPITTTDPLGNVTKMTYDLNGNLETVTDGNGHVSTTNVYDAADQLIEATNANAVTTKTAYNALGQAISRTDGKGNVREYKRDLLGRVTEVIDPLGRKTVNQYDLGGNLVKATDSEGRTTVYSYDAADRQTKMDYSDPATTDVSLTYDKHGNVTEMTDGTGTTKLVYDALDRPLEVLGGGGQVVKYEYSLADDITKIVYPNGKAITRGYDKVGRLEKVVDWLGNETKFSYYQDSLLKSTTFPAATGNVDEYTYDPSGSLTKISMLKGTESLASLSYARDKIGQVESVLQKGLPGGESLAYEYDAGNRLLKGAGVPYVYDAANNITKKNTVSYTYDKAGQIATASNAAFAYDKLGQRIKRTPTGEPATSYAYDQAGNLISVQRPAEGSTSKIDETYKSDGTGLRVSESVDGVSRPLVWDRTLELPVLLSNGSTSYIYGPDGLPIEQINSNEEARFLHHDQQGSTRLLTDATGKVVGTYHYGPYGTIESFTGTVTTPLGFGGQYRSPNSGLIYLRARVYDPITGQFLSVDPMVGTSGEPYSYAAVNPINWSDPSGLIPGQNVSWCGPGGANRITALEPVVVTASRVSTFELVLQFFPPPDWDDIIADAAQDAVVGFWMSGGLAGPGFGLAGAGLGALKGAAWSYGEQVVKHNVKRFSDPNSGAAELTDAAFWLVDYHGKGSDLIDVVNSRTTRSLFRPMQVPPSPLLASKGIPRGPAGRDVIPPWVRAGKRR